MAAGGGGGGGGGTAQPERSSAAGADRRASEGGETGGGGRGGAGPPRSCCCRPTHLSLPHPLTPVHSHHTRTFTHSTHTLSLALLLETQYTLLPHMYTHLHRHAHTHILTRYILATSWQFLAAHHSVAPVCRRPAPSARRVPSRPYTHSATPQRTHTRTHSPAHTLPADQPLPPSPLPTQSRLLECIA